MTSPLFSVEQSEKTSDDYLTPRWVFDTLGLIFDLDVAAPPWETHVPAARKFTKADDGLSQEWEGRVWMNPPFSNIAPWAERFITHRHGIAIFPFSKSAWGHRVWQSVDGLVFAGPHASNFVGGPIFMPVLFACFGDECVEALGRLGRVR